MVPRGMTQVTIISASLGDLALINIHPLAHDEVACVQREREGTFLAHLYQVLDRSFIKPAIEAVLNVSMITRTITRGRPER